MNECEDKKIEPDIHLFLHWMIEKKIVPAEEAKIGFVVSEVNNLSYCRDISKTAAVREIEANYSIPESTCFYILDKHQKRHA